MTEKSVFLVSVGGPHSGPECLFVAGVPSCEWNQQGVPWGQEVAPLGMVHCSLKSNTVNVLHWRCILLSSLVVESCHQIKYTATDICAFIKVWINGIKINPQIKSTLNSRKSPNIIIAKYNTFCSIPLMLSKLFTMRPCILRRFNLMQLF